MKPAISPLREPNGRAQRDPAPPSPTQVRRLRDAALRDVRHAEWGTELGRLFLAGDHDGINSEMYAAGIRWTKDAARWRASLGVFPVRSAALERGHAHPIDPDSPEGQEQAERDRRALERFLEAHAVLVAAGSGAERAVVALCEKDESPTFVDRLCARAGLRALAQHYGLISSENRPNCHSGKLD